jgi:protein TonB
MATHNISHGKALGISLLCHVALLGLTAWPGRFVQPAQIAEAVPVEIVSSKLLSTGDMGGAGDDDDMRQEFTGSAPVRATIADETAAETKPPAGDSPDRVGEVGKELPVLQGNSVEPDLTQLTSAGMHEQEVAGPTIVTGGEDIAANEAEANEIGRSGVGEANGAGDFGDQAGNGSGGAGMGGAHFVGGAAPRYPAAARKAGWEGIVLARVLVDTRGKAAVVSVRKSSGYSLLDEAVIKAVKKWRFSPATQAGKPIAGFHDVKVRFRLDDPQ